MSYILDALRKAETERALTLASCIASPQHKGSARSGLAAKRIVLLVMAVACAMAITWWWAKYTITMPAQASISEHKPNKPPGDAPAGATVMSANPQPSPRLSPRPVVSPPVSTFVPGTSIDEELSVAGEAAPSSVSDANKTETNTVVLASALPVREADRPATVTADIETVQGIPSTAPAQDEENVTEKMVATAMIAGEAKALGLTPTAHPFVEAPGVSAQTTVDEQTAEMTPVEPEPPLLRTLPYRFQTTLPKMVINAQAYAEEADARFVIINMKKYQEGDRTEAGILVEKIAEAYLVMSYQGQVFRMQR